MVLLHPYEDELKTLEALDSFFEIHSYIHPISLQPVLHFLNQKHNHLYSQPAEWLHEIISPVYLIVSFHNNHQYIYLFFFVLHYIVQQVIDTCGKNYPTLKKIRVLFNQLYNFALKNDICNKDYSAYVDIAQYKDRNPNKYDRNKFSKEEVAKLWTNSILM